MAATIKIKRSETSGNPAVLGAGELAYSALTDNGSNGGDRLYVGTGTETDGNAVNHVVIGGKHFTDMLDQTPGVLTANSALVVDADKKLDELLVDGLSLNGTTLGSTGDLKLNTVSGIELNGTVNKIVSGPYAGTSVDFQSYGLILRQDRGGSIDLKVGDSGSVTSTMTLNNDGSVTVPGTIKTLSNADLKLTPNGTGKVKISDAFTLPATAGTDTYVLTSDGAGGTSWQSTQVAAGTGDVFGPASSVDNTIARFDSVSGKAIQGSALSINDAGGLVFGDTTVQTTAFTGTKSGVGLGNVDNTSDADKPVSTATQTALDLKATLDSPTFTGTVSGITQGMVGLGNVTNESKATMFSSPAFTGTVSVAGSIVPTTNVAYDLGSTTYRFKDLYLSGNTIDLGGVLISAAAGSVTFPGITNTPIGATNPSTGSFTTLATSGNLVVGGDLTVNGTVTSVNSTTVTVTDKNLELAKVDTPTNITANGGGITVKGATDKTLSWLSATESWTSSENLDIATGKVYKIGQTDVLSATALGSSVVGSSLTSVGTIGTGTWQGTPVAAAYVATLNQDTTGSAAKLTTARAINGVDFDGSAAITVTAAAGTLTGSTLNSSVVTSSLTSVGTIGTGVWQGSVIDGAYIATLNQNTTGSAAKLTTARAINGVDFDGTAAITVTAAAGTLTGTALPATVVSSSLTSVGTIATGVWQGTAIGAAYVSTLNQNTTGSAATLTTPRAINGVNFDGSAAITVTAAAGTLSGTTLNSSVISSSLTAVGTLTSAVWNATTIAAGYGGTGLTTATSRGILFGNGSSALGVTAASSTDGSFLRADSTGNPYFSNVIDGGTY